MELLFCLLLPIWGKKKHNDISPVCVVYVQYKLGEYKVIHRHEVEDKEVTLETGSSSLAFFIIIPSGADIAL